MGSVSQLPGQQVYECGKCGAQGHRLLEDNGIVCAKCLMPSLFAWYAPVERHPQHKARLTPLLNSREYGDQNFACCKCRFNKFHLHESGSISCYRCKQNITFKHWLPDDDAEGAC